LEICYQGRLPVQSSQPTNTADKRTWADYRYKRFRKTLAKAAIAACLGLALVVGTVKISHSSSAQNILHLLTKHNDGNDRFYVLPDILLARISWPNDVGILDEPVGWSIDTICRLQRGRYDPHFLVPAAVMSTLSNHPTIAGRLRVVERIILKDYEYVLLGTENYGIPIIPL